VPGGGSAARAQTRRARLRGPQRGLEAGAHDVEHVAVALRELALGAAEPRDHRLAATGAHADRDPVLDAGSVEQVAVQLAVGQAAGLDGLGEAQRRTPASGMRGQQRVTRRLAHDCAERAGRLGTGRDRLVANGARGELDAVPTQHVRGDELGERPERATTQFGLRPGLDDRPGEPARGAHVCVGEPRHNATTEHTPRGVAFRVGGSAPARASQSLSLPDDLQEGLARRAFQCRSSAFASQGASRARALAPPFVEKGASRSGPTRRPLGTSSGRDGWWSRRDCS
jgi:hypothetical protein